MSDLTVLRGTAVRSRTRFADLAGDPIDPVQVFCRVKAGEEEVTYEYGSDEELVKLEDGHYQLWIRTDEPGDERVARWIGVDAGGNKVVNEETFSVEDTAFETADPV